MVPVKAMTENREAIDSSVILSRLKQATPEAEVVETSTLTAYDSYYYSRDDQAPLPVVRVKLKDTDSTWIYVDPEVGRVVGHVNRMNRIERWLYNGLHNLDFSFLYYNRPVWDAVVIVLSMGGAFVSGAGFLLGMRRLRRGIQRTSRWITGIMN